MRIILTVSGGIDSMYLAERAAEFFPGASFAVAHCNFCLRGEESDEDAAFVTIWCESRGIPFFIKEFDTAGHAASKGISTEMAARELRYGWFASLCREKGYDAIAVAHNANDNAETLLLNILRGTGSRGLRGMAAESRQGDLVILRPMLGVSRQEITDWMKRNGKSWREDSTNSGCDYKRNKLRNLVFPVFHEINPSFIRTLGEDMRRFSLSDDIAESYFQRHSAEVSDGNSIDVRKLLALDHWEYVLWRLLEKCSFSYETFRKMTALLEKYRSEPSGTVTLGGKVFESPEYIVKAVRKRLLIFKKDISGT